MKPKLSNTRVKICGITTLDDALLATGAGADMLGFNFYPPSPRYLTPQTCRTITDQLRDLLGDDCPLLVGVFVNEPEVAAIIGQAGIDCAQLHGDESPAALVTLDGRAFKAIRPRDRNEAWELAEAFLAYEPSDERMPALLVDAYHKDLYGGTGEQTSVAIALAAGEQSSRMMLAGGLTPDNVGERIQAIQPWGVDVASGVEGKTKGRKDESCIRAFMAAVRIADTRS
jgi:phosphoribosylanthranilate isomerase